MRARFASYGSALVHRLLREVRHDHVFDQDDRPTMLPSAAKGKDNASNTAFLTCTIWFFVLPRRTCTSSLFVEQCLWDYSSHSRDHSLHPSVVFWKQERNETKRLRKIFYHSLSLYHSWSSEGCWTTRTRLSLCRTCAVHFGSVLSHHVLRSPPKAMSFF